MRSDKHVLSQDVPSPLRALHSLFEGRLADVRFPGVDSETLAAACDRVGECIEAINEARRAFDAAQAELDTATAEAQLLGRRALAYAEVYAEDDGELLEALIRIRQDLGPDGRTGDAKPRTARRRKKKKTSAADPELPLEPPDGDDAVIEAA